MSLLLELIRGSDVTISDVHCRDHLFILFAHPSRVAEQNPTTWRRWAALHWCIHFVSSVTQEPSLSLSLSMSVFVSFPTPILRKRSPLEVEQIPKNRNCEPWFLRNQAHYTSGTIPQNRNCEPRFLSFNILLPACPSGLQAMVFVSLYRLYIFLMNRRKSNDNLPLLLSLYSLHTKKLPKQSNTSDRFVGHRRAHQQKVPRQQLLPMPCFSAKSFITLLFVTCTVQPTY